MANWGICYKVGQFYYKVSQVLQSGESIITSRAGSCYCKVVQELFQNGAGNLLQSGAMVIAKWVRCYKMEQLYYKVAQVLAQWYWICEKNCLREKCTPFPCHPVYLQRDKEGRERERKKM